MKTKQILWGILIIGVLSLPTLILVNEKKTVPTFWNYEQHISDKREKGLRESLGYSIFSDLDELEAAISSKKVIAAIGSDYQAAKFIKEGIIQKIDFEKLWGLKYTNSDELKSQLKNIYTPFTFKALDEAFDLEEKKLWQYVVPYLSQEKVIAFDINKSNKWTAAEKEKLKTPEGVKSLFPNKSYKGIFNTLKNKGYHRLIVNDYVRGNMMIGSEISSGGFNSLPTEKNYKTQINNFKQIIEDQDGFNQSILSNNVKFDSAGTSVLQDLINPNKNWDTALLYNGDALDAYNANNHFENIKNNHFIRVVFPENPIYLIDTLFIPTYINDDSPEKLLTKTYNAIKTNLFENANIPSLDGIEINENKSGYPKTGFPILDNFNFIVYSVPYQVYDEAIKNRFFKKDDGSNDEIAKNMYELTITPSDKDISNYFSQQIDNTLVTSIYYYYMLMKN